MNVGFFLVDNGSVDAAMGFPCADILVRSVRKAMPGVRVTHFTDEATRAVEAADEVKRLPLEPMAMLRMKHHAQVSGEWLFLDSDVYVQRDVRPVFETPFDICLTTRNWAHLEPAEGFTKRMPFNVGVVFSRCPSFWEQVYKRVAKCPDDLRHWMGDQQVICDMVTTLRYKFHFLKGDKFNFPPAMVDTDDTARMTRKAYIVHYKGLNRKPLMMARGEPCESA